MVELQLRKEALCSGRVVRLVPHIACQLGVGQALVYWQLCFLSTNGCSQEILKPVRISYTRLQKHFPFFTRRWLIEIVGRLKQRGAITVLRTNRLNCLDIVGEYPLGPMPKQSDAAQMLVFPDLACKAGLLEAVALQQIHLRHNGLDGSAWVVKSMTQWHVTVFPFVGIATVKRLFARLQNQGLIYTRKCDGQGIPVNGYRVNYVRVANVLGIPVPERPKVASGQPDVLYPLGCAAPSLDIHEPETSNEASVNIACAR